MPVLAGVAGFLFVAQAADQPAAKIPAKKPAVPNPKPTLADVHYGPAANQVLDFYKAESKEPAPLMFYMHGGAWLHRGKTNVLGLAECIAAGISVVSIEYRLVDEAMAAQVMPPVQWPMHDAARALQFVRSKAADWNIDKRRIGMSGTSAGACTSLWLAFHDDMADPRSDDPVARESTRLMCVAVREPQTSLDPKQMKEWMPNSGYGGHAFGFTSDSKNQLPPFQRFLEGRESVLKWIKEYSPYQLVTQDDPPVYMFFAKPLAPGQNQQDPTHSAIFGIKLQEHLRDNGVACELVYPDAPEVKHRSPAAYLIDMLKPPARWPMARSRKMGSRTSWFSFINLWCWQHANQASEDCAGHPGRVGERVIVKSTT